MFAKLTDYLKNNKKSLIAAIIILIPFVLYYFWLICLSGDFFKTHSQNEPNRQILLEIRNEIQLGDSYENVLKNFWSKKSCRSNLTVNVYSPEDWSISMRSEIFETDWRMYIKFRDGKVVGHRIRNSDGLHPKAAPEDIGKTDE
ncbi:MAG TPA: hypothetical protein VF599_16970 [Pyrinomonadaceae bacterium]